MIVEGIVEAAVGVRYTTLAAVMLCASIVGPSNGTRFAIPVIVNSAV